MRKNLQKLKNIIGLSALAIMGVLAFLGLNYQLANGIAAAFITIFMLGFSFLFWFFALKGREERGGHSKKWIIIGWVCSVLYILSLIFMIPDIEHFIAVSQTKNEIQNNAHEKVDAMKKITADFYEKVETRSVDLENDLKQLIIHDQSQLRNIYRWHTGTFDYKWVATEKKGLITTILTNEVDKLTYEMIESQWSGGANTKSKEASNEISTWNILTIAQTMETLDQDIKKNINVLKTSYAYQDLYSKHYNIEHKYEIDGSMKSQLEKEIYKDYFAPYKDSTLGLLIALLLVVLASFPVIFVPLNRVRPINKRFADIYQKGFPISDFN